MSSPFVRRMREIRRRQGVTNGSVLSVIALGAVGVMLGTGVAGTAVGVSDGVTWLADIRSGEVLHYNPGTNRVERAYRVGRPGDDIAISQASGMVALRNERTGEVVTVDMSRMRAAGARATGARAKVLVARGMMVLVDREKGSLRRVDPVRTSDLGQPWQSSVPIADAVADQQGIVWVMATDGTLRALVWNDETDRFDQQSVDRVDKVTDDGRLAPHPEGVTVFGPRAGVIAQAGTPNDGYRQSNQLVGVTPQVIEGPADLVVGALPNQAAVVILDRGEVRQVSTAELGCARPIEPAAFNNRMYVVCQGSSKVIQLTREGRVAGPEIQTPGGADAEPVADEGRLVLNVSGAGQGIDIDRAGSEKNFDRTPDEATQTMRVESDSASDGVELGRQQAHADLAMEPVPQAESGAGNVETSPDNFETRTEMVDSGAGREPSSEETAIPESQIQIPAPPAVDSEPQQAEPGSEPEPEPEPVPEQAVPVPVPVAEPILPTPGARLPGPTPTAAPEIEEPEAVPGEPLPSEPVPSQSELAPEPGEPVPSVPVPSAPAPSVPGPTAPGPTAPAPTAPAPSAPALNVPAPVPGDALPTGPLSNAPVPSGPAASEPAPAPSEPAPSEAGPLPMPSEPVPPAPVPSVPVPSGPAPSAPVPTTTAPPTTVPTTPPPTSATTTAIPTTEPPVPLAAPEDLMASANDTTVTVTWSHPDEADRFDVAVGGRTVQVLGSARTATVTGNEPGTNTVTVTVVRGDEVRRSASTTVSVSSPTPPPTATPPPTTATPSAPTPPPTATAPPATTRPPTETAPPA